MNRLRISMILTGLVVTFTAQAQSAEPFRFSLVATSATCFPNASATVTVLPKEEDRGVDTLDLKATPFDGDGQAGATVLSSKNFLPNAPLP